MQRKLAAIGLGAAAFAAPAAAQDTGWSGFHIGLNGTGHHQSMGTSGTADVQQVSNLFWPGRGLIIVPGTAVSFPSAGVSRSDRSKNHATLGAQAGFDWQFGGLVAGIEGDIQGTRRSQTTIYTTMLPFTAITPPTTVTLQRTARINTEWSARLRLGAALHSTLIYGTGGVAGARIGAADSDTFFDPGGQGAGCGNADPATCLRLLGPNGPVNFGPSGPTVTSGTYSKTKIGWTAGAGLEQRLGSHFSIGLEYRHTDLGAIRYGITETLVSQGAVITDSLGNQPLSQPQVTASTTRATLRSDAISLRLSFRF